RLELAPQEPEDDEVRALVNAHQRPDKGFGGPALGPGAATAALHAFTLAGFTCSTAPSDWPLEPADAAVPTAFSGRLRQAATEMAPGRAAAFDAWRTRRLEHVARGRSTIVVGHVDFAALRAHSTRTTSPSSAGSVARASCNAQSNSTS